MEPDITITSDELVDESIDNIINLEKSLASGSSEQEDEIKTPFYFNTMFYYAVSAFLGALIAWGITEPFYTDTETAGHIGIPFLEDFLIFGPVASFVALGIAGAYGASNRNFKQMLYCSVVGMGAGLLATLLTTFVGEIIYGIMGTISFAIARDSIPTDPNENFELRGIAFFIHMCGRGLAWAVVSLGAGLGLGVALKSKKHIFNGIAGGIIGGFLGGVLFDPICRITISFTTEAAVSRGIGLSCIGIMTGFFIGLIENMSKESWFLMQKGPLTGKQFILFKAQTLIGSSPKADIYLFKDPAIDAKHAKVAKSGNKYILTTEGQNAAFVNGRQIDKYVLQNGDIITIGETVLKYMEKNKS